MSEAKKSPGDKPANDAKAKMLEALAKKQGRNNSGVKTGPVNGSKVSGEAGANAPKMFRRKSGPSGSAG
jgi:hypothetical protein